MSDRYQWPTKDRRTLRDEFESRRKVLEINTHDSSRLVKMASRKLRRELQGDKFRPVYHHGIPIKIPHKDIISAMLVHKDGRRTAQRWQTQLKIARACVAWGFAVRSLCIG